jgi:protease IV
VTYLERPLSFREQLLDMLAQQERDEGEAPTTDGFAFIANSDLKLAQAMAELRSVLTGPNIQVRCLECPGVAPARVERKDLGVLAAIGEWLF